MEWRSVGRPSNGCREYSYIHAVLLLVAVIIKQRLPSTKAACFPFHNRTKTNEVIGNKETESNRERER